PALVWMILSSALPAEELPEIVSIGSYTPTPAGRLSRAAAVVDTADVEARRSVDGADLLRHVAGVHVAQPTGPGGVTSVFVRGGEPNFTVVLIDGVRVNDPMSTRGGSFDFTTLAAGEISRLELVRGPQSAVHGSDAIGGVINVVTHEPDDRFSGRFDVE